MVVAFDLAMRSNLESLIGILTISTGHMSTLQLEYVLHTTYPTYEPRMLMLFVTVKKMSAVRAA